MTKQFLDFETKPGFGTLWDDQPTSVTSYPVDVNQLRALKPATEWAGPVQFLDFDTLPNMGTLSDRTGEKRVTVDQLRNLVGLEPAFPIFIIKGETTGAFYGEAIADGTLEWQFSDGPAGGRGSSSDYLSLLEGLEAHQGAIFNTDEADFTPAERFIFECYGTVKVSQ